MDSNQDKGNRFLFSLIHVFLIGPLSSSDGSFLFRPVPRLGEYFDINRSPALFRSFIDRFADRRDMNGFRRIGVRTDPTVEIQEIHIFRQSLATLPLDRADRSGQTTGTRRQSGK